MEKTDPVVSFLLDENILAETELTELVESCASTGQSLISVLKNESKIDQDQLTKVTALSNDIEFIDLNLTEPHQPQRLKMYMLGWSTIFISL